MDKIMHQKLVEVSTEFERLSQAMGTQEIAADPKAYREVAQKQSGISDLVRVFREYERDAGRLAEAEQILHDESDLEYRQMAEEERRALWPIQEEREKELRLLLLPKDPHDAKDTIVEIRAGTGGEEAGLFVSDLFRLYTRYAERMNWRIDILSSAPTGMGGFKEISFKVEGENVFSRLKFEGGVHRVQRVPDTETQGRIHTSAVTVAVLPEAEEVELHIDPTDLQFDVYRSSGPGGQSVNTTDSAVRVTYKPTGMIVTCQDEKSQHKNKAKALSILRARLLAIKEEEEDAKRSANRKGQVGSGDRSERIRTYNFPQNRVTDHRINMTLYSLEYVMDGDIQTLVDGLTAADRADRLSQINED